MGLSSKAMHKLIMTNWIVDVVSARVLGNVAIDSSSSPNRSLVSSKVFKSRLEFYPAKVGSLLLPGLNNCYPLRGDIAELSGGKFFL